MGKGLRVGECEVARIHTQTIPYHLQTIPFTNHTYKPYHTHLPHKYIYKPTTHTQIYHTYKPTTHLPYTQIYHTNLPCTQTYHTYKYIYTSTIPCKPYHTYTSTMFTNTFTHLSFFFLLCTFTELYTHDTFFLGYFSLFRLNLNNGYSYFIAYSFPYFLA